MAKTAKKDGAKTDLDPELYGEWLIGKWKDITARTDECKTPTGHDIPSDIMAVILSAIARLKKSSDFLDRLSDKAQKERITQAAMAAYHCSYGVVKDYTDVQDWHPKLPRKQSDPLRGFESLMGWCKATVEKKKRNRNVPKKQPSSGKRDDRVKPQNSK